MHVLSQAPTSTSVVLLLTVAAALSIGNFQPALTGGGEGLMQQLTVVAIWGVLIILSYVPSLAQRPAPTTGRLWITLLIAYAVVSPVWSANIVAGFSKSAVLLLTSFAAWRMTTLVTFDEFYRALKNGLTCVMAASVLLVLFVPSIGVLRTWQHSGQWSGVFVSKQLLGAAGAFLVLLALLDFLRWRRWRDLGALLLALACVLGAESRGGGAIAVLAVISIVLARRSRVAASLLAAVPLITCAFAFGLIAYLAATGYEYFPVAGHKIDLTERTLIWQYGLRFWKDHMLLGFGLNGFWSNEALYFGFLKQHEWVLENFHSGYNTTVIELGLIGYALFIIATARLCGSLRKAAGDKDPDKRFQIEKALGFLLLIYVIDLTETFFLRSTNFLQITFVFTCFALSEWRAPSRRSERRPASAVSPDRLGSQSAPAGA